MSFAAPLYLLLLVALVLVPLIARRSIEEPVGPRRLASNLVRGALVTVLVLALARPAARGLDERLTVVFAVDASESIGGEGREAMARYLAAAKAVMGQHDRAAVVVYARDAVVETAPSPLLPLPPYASRPLPGGTDAAAAVRLASALFAPGDGRRIVLLSDGEENRGALLEAAAAATSAGIDLTLVPIPGQSQRDARVDALDAPAHAMPGEPFDLRLVVLAGASTAARLRTYEGHTLLSSEDVTLEAGHANLFLLKAEATAPGVHTYRVELSAEGDPTPQNNTAEATVEVAGEPRVLLAGTRPETLAPLARLLEREHIGAELTPPDGIPRTLSGLRRYRTVLLSNIAAEDLGEELMATLAAYARDAGGSLVMAGGERSFGPGGYLATPIEEVLPVGMEVKERRYFPTVALVTAIDKSGSMAGVGKAQKIEVAKAGAAAAIEVLEERDEAGVVAFDSAAKWVARLTPLSARKSVLQRLATLRAGGGTDIYPAMSAAYDALKRSDRRVKHLIVLTDGQSPERDYQGLAAKMARDGITVSTVAVGDDADTYTLRLIAEAGKGRAYLATDPALLPRIFTKEALTIQRSYVVEEPFRAHQVGTHEVLSGIDFAAAPPLHGYVATWEKGQGELLLASHRNDPLLAVWRVGVGKAVAFTPDVAGPWAREWPAWPGWAQMWSQLFRWCAAEGAPGGIAVHATVDAGRLHGVADLVGAGGEYVNFARLEAAVVTPNGRRASLKLRQIAPGRYEARADAGEPGSYLATVTLPGPGGAAASGSATVDVPYAVEFRPSGQGHANLERVAAVTGAKLATGPEAVFRHDLPIPGDRKPLEPWLLALLPFLLLVDVGVRRVALPGGWLGRLLRPVLARLAPSRKPAAVPSLGRLHEVKAAATERRDEAPAAPPPPSAAPATNQPPPPPSAPAATPPLGTTTSHLLDAKKRRSRDS